MKDRLLRNKLARICSAGVVVASGLALYAFAAQLDFADLIAGNQRFYTGQMQHPNQSIERRLEVARGQHPHTIVLTCSDSRSEILQRSPILEEKLAQHELKMVGAYYDLDDGTVLEP